MGPIIILPSHNNGVEKGGAHFHIEDENEGGDDVDNDDDLIMRMAVKMVMKVVMMLICARV